MQENSIWIIDIQELKQQQKRRGISMKIFKQNKNTTHFKIVKNQYILVLN